MWSGYENSQKIISFLTYFILYKLKEASRGGEATAWHNCKSNRLWGQFLIEEMKYLVFTFL